MTKQLEHAIERISALPETQQNAIAKLILGWAEGKMGLPNDFGDGSKYAPPAVTKRIAGLGEGTIDIPDDFDDPLPESFWLGKE